jgi:RNA polymerase sigma-70 factor (ECF subfamily)
MLATNTSPITPNFATPAPVETDSAFERAVLPLTQELRHRALRLERSRAEADDLLQDTLERALRGFERFRSGTNVRVWLHTIMFHLFIDRCRRRTHERLLEPAAAEELPSPQAEPRAPWEEIGDDQVRDALARLEQPFRAIGELHWIEHRSYREISDRLGIPLGTVGTRLLRARRKMRRLLDATGA